MLPLLRRCFSTNQRSFAELGVSSFWFDRLTALGCEVPTGTQRAVLPPLLQGRSAIVRGETGSGKTLAYLLPILEALRERLSVHDPAAQLLPVGLIVAPSPELVGQVVGVARALYPEYSNLVLPCHGQVGAPRRRNAGVLVATPLAAMQVINPVHLGALRYLVLDEVDALLTGAFKAPMRGGLLPRMKQLPPEARPVHVFCGATLPEKGQDSALAFLDKWYPPPDTLRLLTPGSHAPLPNVVQTFMQVDFCVPLSPLEIEAQKRAGEAAPPPARLVDEEGEPLEQQREPIQGSKGEKQLVDNIARAFESRRSEDEYLEMRAKEEAHAQRVWAVAQLAVYEALLLPAKILGLLGKDDSAACAATPSLQDLEEGMAPSRKKARAKKAASVREARPLVTVETLASLPTFGLRSYLPEGSTGSGTGAPPPLPFPWLHPYTPPTDFSPPALSHASAALVPPTLVFVNSSTAAHTLRNALAARCAGFFTVAELCGELDGAARNSRLEAFEDGRVRVLICTNMAARGLDFKGAAHVIEAEFAQNAEAFVHRTGRTGRAGNRGCVTSLLTRASLPLAAKLVESVEGAISPRRSAGRGTNAAVKPLVVK